MGGRCSGCSNVKKVIIDISVVVAITVCIEEGVSVEERIIAKDDAKRGGSD